MKKAIIFTTLFLPSLLFASLPEEWYTLSPHQTFKKKYSKREAAKNIKATTTFLSQSFDKFEKKTQNHKEKLSWKPVAIATSLSLTARGNIGLLTTGGTATAGLVWFPREKKTPEAPLSPDLQDYEDYEVHNESTQSQDLEPAIQALLKNPKIDLQEEELRKAFQTVGSEVLSIARQLPTQVTWEPIMIQGFLYFSAGGRWSTVLTASSTFRVGITWRNQDRPTPFKQSSSLSQTIHNLSQELEKAISTTPFQNPPVAAAIRLNIAANGDIGIGWGGTGVQISLSLKRVVKPQRLVLSTKTPVFQHKSKNQKLSQPLYIKARTFKKGLKKSLQIGKFFLRRFRYWRGRWQPKAMFLSFQISGGGDIALVTTTAQSSLTFIYLIPDKRSL